MLSEKCLKQEAVGKDVLAVFKVKICPASCDPDNGAIITQVS